MIETKQCFKCKEVKSREEFYHNSKSKDGLFGSCKNCIDKTKTKYNKQCPTCGKPFETINKKAKFCSKDCIRHIHQCLNCNKTFVSKVGNSKYCSDECLLTFVVEWDEKKCSKCGITKKNSEFYADKTNPSGKSSECKDCYRKRKYKRRREQKLKEYMEFIGYEELDKTIPQDIDLNQTKPCTICHVDKPLKEFRPVYVNKKFNRFHAHCKECASKKGKEYRYKRELEKFKAMKERGRD